MRTLTHLAMYLLLLPALLLSGCLGDDPAPQAAPQDADSEAAAAPADGPAQLGGAPPATPPRCADELLFTYQQSGTWTDRQTTETFDVPEGTEELAITLRVSLLAAAEYRATVEDPKGNTWYHAYMVGYQIENSGYDLWGGYREGHWGTVEHAAPLAGEHSFAISHLGPVEDLEYTVIGTVCREA